MFRLYMIVLALCVFSSMASAQKLSISGYVMDLDTQEKLLGATLGDTLNTLGAVSNTYGYFSLDVLRGACTVLVVSYVGYQKQILKLCPKSDTVFNVALKPDPFLEEVVVYAEPGKKQLNSIQLSPKQISYLPKFTGEVDFLRVLQLMPGVSGGLEGTSSLHVRGGNHDQNLVLLDDVPLYYLNHLGGFISIFDSYAIKSINLYKNGFSSRYGGRLSSVLDISMNEGNMEAYHGEASVGLIMSKLAIEGPIVKKKASFFLSMRKAYMDVFMRPLAKQQSQGETVNGYTFHDINAKVNFKTGKDHFYLSMYLGRDLLYLDHYSEHIQKDPDFVRQMSYKFDNYWGNRMVSARWNRTYGSKLFSNTTVAYTHFHYNNESSSSSTMRYSEPSSEDVESRSSFLFLSDVRDYLFKADFDYFLSNDHLLKFGVHSTYHQFRPNYTKSKQLDVESSSQGEFTLNAIEPAIYMEDEFKRGKISGQAGAYLSGYFIADARYFSLQPRLRLDYILSGSDVLEIAYSRMQQPLHLLSTVGSSLPSDLWVPATEKLAPQEADQLSLSYKKKVRDLPLELEASAFYKQMHNLIDYKEGNSFIGEGINWEERIEAGGKGIARGVEFSLTKVGEKLTGWLSYTLSKNERQFESINQGRKYPFTFDRTHDLSITGSYNFSKNKILSANWVYATGIPLTIGNSKYVTKNFYKWRSPFDPTGFNGNDDLSQLLNYFDETVFTVDRKHNVRMPSYHRLDLSMNFIKEKKKGIRTFSLSIYNVYNRMNAYYIYSKNENGKTTFYKYTLFPIIPSCAYSFRF